MGEKHYYYKVKLDTHRGRCISEFIEKGKKAAQAAEELMTELGASGYTDSPRALYPGVGIGSLVFKGVPNLWQFESIGKGEFIPNRKTDAGKEVAKRIAALPEVSSDDFRLAFGIPVNQFKTPAWFIYNEKVYVCSSYSLGTEYTQIVESEFMSKKKKVK